MATPPIPSATMSASNRCRSGASGVVRSMPAGRPPTLMPVVPITPGVIPASRRIPSRRYVVVVFPFVPVTPIMVSRSAGRPKNSAATGPMACRTEGTTTLVTGRPRSSRLSAITEVAPASTAAAAKSCPSTRVPGTQKKSHPGRTRSDR